MSKRYHLFGENLTLIKENHFTKTEKKEIRSSNLEGMIIFVNLENQGGYTSLIDDLTIQPKKQHTVMGLLNGHTEGLVYYPKNANMKYLSLLLKKEYLFQILSHNNIPKPIYKFFDSKAIGQNYSHKKTNPKTQALAYEILHTPYKGNLDKLYIEAKTLELLHTEFNSLLTNNSYNDSHIKFSKQDKEAIYYAKEILLNNISNPPSLKELSYLVKLNEFKLKSGFKKFFHQTPYSISIESRLQEAKKLLEKSEFNINEIASKVGYKYTQSFSAAYLKRFGIRPKELMKSRKYYY